MNKNCKTCDIPDLNCYEQCKEEERCKGCFGASFNDCFECDRYKKEEKDVSEFQKKQVLHKQQRKL